MISRENVRACPRFAGAVRRYHTWPTIQQQTVADHTWNVIRVWWSVFGPLTAEESTYALWHDAGELLLGDLPFPVKAERAALKTVCDVVEAEGLLMLLGFNPLRGASETTRLRCKVADLVEMHEFGVTELLLGNKLAQPIIEDTWSALVVLLRRLESEVSGKIVGYVNSFRMGLGLDACDFCS